MRVTADELCTQFKEYQIIDLRNKCYYDLYHIPYSIHIASYEGYEKKCEKKLCFVCNKGDISRKMAERFSGSYYLEGGLEKWVSSHNDDHIFTKCVVGEVCDGVDCYKE